MLEIEIGVEIEDSMLEFKNFSSIAFHYVCEKHHHSGCIELNQRKKRCKVELHSEA